MGTADDRLGCEAREVPLRRLRPGDRFELVLSRSKPRGTLVRIGPGTAAVIIDGHETERLVRFQDGREAKLRRMGGLSYWDTGTPVVPLKEKRDVSRWTEIGGAMMDLDPESENKEEHMAGARAVASLVPGRGRAGQASAGARPGPVKVRDVKPRAPKQPKQLNPCLCGCGEMVAGRFRMGHDSRYYSILKKVVAGKMKFGEMSEYMRKQAKNVPGCAQIIAASGH